MIFPVWYWRCGIDGLVSISNFDDGVIEHARSTAFTGGDQERDLDRSHASADGSLDVVFIQPVLARLAVSVVDAQNLSGFSCLFQNLDDLPRGAAGIEGSMHHPVGGRYIRRSDCRLAIGAGARHHQGSVRVQQRQRGPGILVCSPFSNPPFVGLSEGERCRLACMFFSWVIPPFHRPKPAWCSMNRSTHILRVCHLG